MSFKLLSNRAYQNRNNANVKKHAYFLLSPEIKQVCPWWKTPPEVEDKWDYIERTKPPSSGEGKKKNYFYWDGESDYYKLLFHLDGWLRTRREMIILLLRTETLAGPREKHQESFPQGLWDNTAANKGERINNLMQSKCPHRWLLGSPDFGGRWGGDRTVYWLVW